MKRKKFKDKWKNQTELGKLFGISSIKIGKILIKEGLKDQKTKKATEKALNEEYAISTPLKDGTLFYLWNLKKCKKLISTEYKPINKIDYYFNEVKKIIKEANKLIDEGSDKLGYMMWECAYDDIPKSIKEQVKNKVEEYLKENELVD